jgi:hypothetical protein
VTTHARLLDHLVGRVVERHRVPPGDLADLESGLDREVEEARQDRAGNGCAKSSQKSTPAASISGVSRSTTQRRMWGAKASIFARAKKGLSALR